MIADCPSGAIYTGPAGVACAPSRPGPMHLPCGKNSPPAAVGALPPGPSFDKSSSTRSPFSRVGSGSQAPSGWIWHSALVQSNRQNSYTVLGSFALLAFINKCLIYSDISIFRQPVLFLNRRPVIFDTQPTTWIILISWTVCRVAGDGSRRAASVLAGLAIVFHGVV